MRTHTGEKLHKCELCDYHKTDHFGMSRHLGIHTIGTVTAKKIQM